MTVEKYINNTFIRQYNIDKATKTLVWIHGIGDSGNTFNQIIKTQPIDNFHHVVIDLPGYGLSAKAEHPKTMKGLADCVIKCLDEIEANNIVLIGHSMGGVIALRMAEQISTRLSALVDIDGNKSLDDCGFSGTAMGVDRETFINHSFPDLIKHLQTKAERNQDSALNQYISSMKICNPQAFYDHAWDLVRESKNDNLSAELGGKIGERDSKDLPRIFIWGTGLPGGAPLKNRVLLYEAEVEMISIFPAGHVPFIDQPQQFAKKLSDWLSKVEQKG